VPIGKHSSRPSSASHERGLMQRHILHPMASVDMRLFSVLVPPETRQAIRAQRLVPGAGAASQAPGFRAAGKERRTRK
jgi:hypothetical protein